MRKNQITVKCINIEFKNGLPSQNETIVYVDSDNFYAALSEAFAKTLQYAPVSNAAASGPSATHVVKNGKTIVEN